MTTTQDSRVVHVLQLRLADIEGELAQTRSDLYEAESEIGRHHVLIEHLRDDLRWAMSYIDSEFTGSGGRLLLKGEEAEHYYAAYELLNREVG